jgi:hypothetical protein
MLNQGESVTYDKHTSGLYYKLVTIVNDDSSIISKWSFKLIDDPRVVIYDRNKFIMQATDVVITTTKSTIGH